MHIEFVNPGFQYMLESIMEFQKDDTSSFWNDSLFYFYKELDNRSRNAVVGRCHF